MDITKFGMAHYLVYHKDELETLGLVKNPNAYIGDGWRFCPICQHYAYVFAMSCPGETEVFEVCKDCNCHHRKLHDPITASPTYQLYLKTFPNSDPRD